MSTDSAASEQSFEQLWKEQLKEGEEYDAQFRTLMNDSNLRVAELTSQLMAKLSGVEQPSEPEDAVMKELIDLLKMNRPLVPYILDFTKKMAEKIAQAANSQASSIMDAVENA